MLSAADIKAIIGADPGVGTAPTPGVCVYNDVNLTLGAFDVNEYDAAVADGKSDPSTVSVKEISGVGDAAVYGTDTDPNNNGVIAKQADIAVAVSGPGSEQELADLATALLAAIG